METKKNEFKFETQTMKSTKTILLEDIVSVYVGTPNNCMCGCSGDYTYSSLHRDYSSKNRGYAVGDDEVSDARVKRILNKFVKSELIAEDNDNYIFTKIIGSRQYTIYLKQQNLVKKARLVAISLQLIELKKKDKTTKLKDIMEIIEKCI